MSRIHFEDQANFLGLHDNDPNEVAQLDAFPIKLLNLAQLDSVFKLVNYPILLT